MPDHVPDGSIVITPKEFYDGVKTDIEEIKTAVAPLTDLRSTVTEHHARLTRLERVAWIALGVALASGGNDLVSLLAR